MTFTEKYMKPFEGEGKSAKDKDLNSIPIKKWDMQVSLIRFLFKNLGVTVYSLSQRVSFLKIG